MKNTVGEKGTHKVAVSMVIFKERLLVVVSCKSWRESEYYAMLEAHATTDHSDVCLSYLLTSHDFNGTLGTNIYNI